MGHLGSITLEARTGRVETAHEALRGPRLVLDRPDDGGPRRSYLDRLARRDRNLGQLLSSSATEPARRVRDELLVRAVVTGVFTSLIFGLLFPDRSDYLGHYLAGFAGTLAVLSLLVMIGPDDRVVVVVGFAAIGLGWMTESTIFKLAIFDPVDFLNQSLGALVAVCLVLGEKQSASRGAALFVLSFGGLIAGFYFAFL